MVQMMELLENEKVLVGITAAVVGLSVKALSSKKPRPPGPRVWPVLGSLPSLEGDFTIFSKLADKFGDIYFMELGFFGTAPTIVLNNVENIREAILSKQDDFAGRARSHGAELFSENGSNIVFGDFTQIWKFQRKIAHTAIRKYASGNQFQDLMERSISLVSEIFEKENANSVKISKAMSFIVSNILARVCFGKNYSLDDPEINWIHSMLEEINELSPSVFLYDVFPLLKYFPSPAVRGIKNICHSINDFVKKYYVEHKRNFDENDVCDITDYVINIEKEIKATGLEDFKVGLTDAQMRTIITDMFIAGVDTTSLTLTWAVLLLASCPEIQKKAQKEIDENIGCDGKITNISRNKIPYCEAIIYETLRIRHPAPLAIPHTTTCDTSVGGFDMPKGTRVIINIWRMHTDPREWENPDQFNPDRFLDKDGNLAPKPNAFLPFSAGRRSCVGEALAKSELHILMGMLLQKFSFYPPEGMKIDVSFKKNLIACLPQEGIDIVVKVR